MADFSGLYDVRDGVENDKNFVLSTFLKGLYYGDSWFSLIPKHIFMENYKVVARAIVNSDSTVIKVACLKEDPDVIIGYSVMSADFQTVHWVYVKAAWRNHGVARSLCPAHPSTVSHLSALGKILLPKFKDAIFNPFKL